MARRSNKHEPLKRSSVVRFEGEIDLHVSPRMAEQLATVIARKPKRVAADISRVTYIDSSGLAVLIEAMQKVEKYGGRFAIVGMQETVRSVFEIARLDQVFRIFPDVEAASVAT